MKNWMIGFLAFLMTAGAWASEFEALQTRYEAEIGSLGEKKQKAIHEWESWYLRSLMERRTVHRDEGDLDAFLAYRTEAERFLEERGLPDPFAELPSLLQLQTEARARLDRLDQVELKELQGLAKVYDNRLSVLERRLTQSDRIEEAMGTMRDMGNTLCNNIGYTWAEF